MCLSVNRRSAQLVSTTTLPLGGQATEPSKKVRVHKEAGRGTRREHTVHCGRNKESWRQDAGGGLECSGMNIDFEHAPLVTNQMLGDALFSHIPTSVSSKDLCQDTARMNYAHLHLHGPRSTTCSPPLGTHSVAEHKTCRET